MREGAVAPVGRCVTVRATRRIPTARVLAVVVLLVTCLAVLVVHRIEARFERARVVTDSAWPVGMRPPQLEPAGYGCVVERTVAPVRGRVTGRTGGGIPTARVLAVVVGLVAGNAVIGVHRIEQRLKGGGVVTGRAWLAGVCAQQVEAA